MRPRAHHPVLYYDRDLRRVWIAGQRCHHGATGAILTGFAAIGLVAWRAGAAGFVTLAATGAALMAHDWHDRSMWFARGRQELR